MSQGVKSNTWTPCFDQGSLSSSWSLGRTGRVLILYSLYKVLHLEEKEPTSQSLSGTRKSLSEGTEAGWHSVRSDVFDGSVERTWV